jgi:hypothetical protein
MTARPFDGAKWKVEMTNITAIKDEVIRRKLLTRAEIDEEASKFIGGDLKALDGDELKKKLAVAEKVLMQCCEEIKGRELETGLRARDWSKSATNSPRLN